MVEDEIWDVVRDSIQTGAIVRVMESATRIAAAHHDVMPLTEIAELLAEATVAAGVPIEIEGLPLAARSPRVRAQNSSSFVDREFALEWSGAGTMTACTANQFARMELRHE